jgi:hypothetical protein
MKTLDGYVGLNDGKNPLYAPSPFILGHLFSESAGVAR